MPNTRPPRLARRLLRRFLSQDVSEFLTGDLDEECERYLLATSSRFAAWRWYWSQTLRSVAINTAQQRNNPFRTRRNARPGVTLMSELLQDIRYSLRTFARTPGLTALMLVTLGVGIGATTAIFSALNEVMLRPLPFAEPDRLAMLWESNDGRGWQQVHAAPANVLDWRERVPAFQDVALVNEYTSGVALTGRDEPVQIVGTQVSGNTFEVGLAVMLIVGAGLMVRSLTALRAVDAGVDISNVLTLEITPPVGTYTTDTQRLELINQFVERIQSIPGVVDAGAGRRLPYQWFAWTSDFTIDNWASDEFGIELRHREASPGYFTTTVIPVLSGSLFEQTIGEGEAVPVVVNRAFADRYFPGESPVGRRIAYDRTPSERAYWYPIVGVVGNERMSVTEEPMPEVIGHLAGDTPRTARIVVKTSIPPMDIVPQVQATMLELDGDIPIVSVRTMDEVAAEALAADQFLMTLLTIFASVALVLAAVGVYGVAAQATRAQTREIGIRLALGATGPTIVTKLLVRGVTYAGIGVVLGIVGSAAAGRVMRGLLFEVEPTDLTTLVSVALLLSLVAVISGYIPAWRATKIDPIRVLKAD